MQLVFDGNQVSGSHHLATVDDELMASDFFC